MVKRVRKETITQQFKKFQLAKVDELVDIARANKGETFSYLRDKLNTLESHFDEIVQQHNSDLLDQKKSILEEEARFIEQYKKEMSQTLTTKSSVFITSIINIIQIIETEKSNSNKLILISGSNERQLETSRELIDILTEAQYENTIIEDIINSNLSTLFYEFGVRLCDSAE